MSKPVILAACRTAGGKFGGQFKSLTATDLGSIAIKETLARSGVSKEDVAEVIMGNGWQAGVGANPARAAMIKAGLSETTPAFTVNIRCGSGLRTVMLAADKIRLDDADAVIAGGMESATNTPYVLPAARWGFRMGQQKAVDVLHIDGFIDPKLGILMGEITEKYVVKEFSISRQEQDEYSYNSHMKAIAAIDKGYFKDEIVPVIIHDKKKGDISLTLDEIARRDTTVEALGKLPALFGGKEGGGTITAGSSSALCDAGSTVMVAGDEWAKANGHKPMAEIVSYAVTAMDPEHFPIAPVVSMNKALEKAKMSLSDIDLVELNEAFAAQVLACDRQMHFDMNRLNICGSAIALGHPVGATCTKILTTLLYSLKREKKELGLVSACIGAGQGVAMVVRAL